MLLALLVLLSFVMVGSVFAQSVPKPAVPEFTLELVDHSYDVPSSTTTTIDPYTGEQTITTQQGYHVINRTIEVAIKNQQFTPYLIDNQRMVYLFYNVSYKGHYEEGWKYHPSGSYARDSTAATSIQQSASDYTIVQFKAPSEGKMDFRVQAQIGYYNYSQLFISVPGAPFTILTFIGEVSGWSEPQTITIEEFITPSPLLTPTPEPISTPYEEPQQTGQEAIFAVAVTIAVLGAGLGLLVYLIKRK
jgi:hypothetical protein